MTAGQDAGAGCSLGACRDGEHEGHDHACPQAVLSVALDAVRDVRGPEGLGTLWNVFSKCKGSLQDGQRLENISWRHWYQTCAAASLRAADARKRMSLTLTDDLDRASSASSADAASVASTSSDRYSALTRSSTRRSASPHSPLSNTSAPASPARSTGQQQWAQNLAPRREPVPHDEAPAGEDAEQPGANRATSTGTTPRPASYPTPSTVRPDFLSTRSLSHAAHRRSQGAGDRWDGGHDLEAWRTSMADRSFGQVLTDVFRVPSVSDLSGKRSPKHQVRARAPTPTSPVTRTPVYGHQDTPTIDRPPASFRSASASAASASAASSPSHPRNPSLLTPDSATRTPDAARGPQVNVMEPTPAPSRVGSLGDAKLLSAGDERGGGLQGMSQMTTLPDQLVEEPGSITAEPSRALLTSSPLSGSHRPGLPSKLTPARASPKNRSPVRKKEKKGMFFIQSPGHAARDGMRQGSASGSEGSASIGSNSLSPMVQARQAASPLSAVELPEAAVAQGQSVERSAQRQQQQQQRLSPAAAVGTSASTDKSASPARPPVVTNKRRTSSASHKPPPIGHRRPSGERTARTVHAAGPTQQAHLAPPKRTASAASMAGKFQGEKARAAEVINARLQRQRQVEKEKQAEARAALYKRQQSEPDLAHAQIREVYGEPILDDGQAGAEDDDDWSSETEDISPVKAGQGLGRGTQHRSQGGQPGMDLARAADEARRQRELFAKRAIYGSQTDLTAAGTAQPAARPGLLSNLFETQRDVIRRNASMVDLAPPPQMPHHDPSKRSRTHHVGSPHAFTINRSKSSVALPVASGVSVSKEGFVGAPDIDANAVDRASTAGRSKLRLPPKPGPTNQDMSPGSSPEDEGPLMGREEAMRRIENLAGRKRDQQSAEAASRVSPEARVSAAQPSAAPLERSYSNPMPVQQAPSAMIIEPALPQTPTTRRRQMLATELPENLRLNLIWERRSRTPLYPPKRTTALKASVSAHDLPDVQRTAALPEERALRMQRQDTQPVQNDAANAQSAEASATAAQQAQQLSALAPRRRTTNLLSGGAILRPLTRTEHHPQASPEQDNNPRAGKLAQRSQSTANVVGLGQQGNRDTRDGLEAPTWTQEPPGIKRSATEGIDIETMREDAWRRARVLKQRQGELSQSFRSHGW